MSYGQVTKDTPCGQVVLRGPVDAIAYAMTAITVHDAVPALVEALQAAQLKISGDNRAAASDVLREQIERALAKLKSNEVIYG
jgi:hypothetical protein